MTFSIVATDGRAVGVAVASKFLAVGSVVPEARLGADGRLVGAAATQATAKWSYKIEAVGLLAEGRDATSAVRQVTEADPDREHRQLGVVGVDSQASYTGGECLDWAGGRSGANGSGRYAIQGNILVGEQVVAEMERAWLDSSGTPLERRLLAALLAGDAAGGDSRGRQSAALLVVAPGEGYDQSGLRVDLRVDEHPEAPRELARLLDLSELYFGVPQDVQPLTGALGEEVAARLSRLGYDGSMREALGEWAGVENYEMRLTDEGIDARVLRALRDATPD
jgi:uncharacterized Ntn-hydrolase superfamily protein